MGVLKNNNLTKQNKMKTITFKIEKLRTQCVGASLLLLMFFNTMTQAQDGRNDATFNTPDKVAAQGSNKVITASAVQPDNKIIITGDFTSYNGVNINYLARLNMDGSLDKTFNPGSSANSTINTIAIQSTKVLIGGLFTNYNGTSVNAIARLNANGSLDGSFKAGIAWSYGISQIIVQPNEKILAAGDFILPDHKFVKGLIRFNKNGSVDNSFHAEITDSIINIQQIALQPDGKVIIAAEEKPYFDGFANFYSVIRLNKNGERDYTFKRIITSNGDLKRYVNSICVENDGNILLAVAIRDNGSIVPFHGYLARLNPQGETIKESGAFWINAMWLQQNGKIIAAGFQNDDVSVLKRKVVRMNSDLTVDSSFLFEDKHIYDNVNQCLIKTSAIQVDGKIVIAGHFSEINGLIANNIARLNSDGSFDLSFGQRTGCDGTVLSAALQTDGKVIIGGEFSRYNYQSSANLARLKKNGELDPSFNVGKGPNGKVNTIAILANDKILIGGSFTSYNGYSCSNIARLNKDGSFDAGFEKTVADGAIRKIAIDRNGKIILAGDFKNVNGVSKMAIVRLLANGKLDATFNATLVTGNEGRVNDFVISSRGQLYLAVVYNGYHGNPYEIGCIRLNRDGSTDTLFKIEERRFNEIKTIAFNNDGKILVGGSGYYEGVTYPTPGIIAQLNTDGSLDTTFHYGALEKYLNNPVRTITVLENDRIIIGGDFTSGRNKPLDHFGLLNSDGSINADFIGSASNNVYTTLLIGTEKMIVGGAFSEYATTVRNSIARINVKESRYKMYASNFGFTQAYTAPVLSVYPNPAASVINIDNLKPGSLVKIFNATGKEINSEIVTTEKYTLDLAQYSNGIYFIVAESTNSRVTSKFIVTK